MGLINADRKASEAIQKRFGFSNYQMQVLSCIIGIVIGFLIAIILF